MDIVLRIDDLTMSKEDITYSDWQISDKSDFSNILLESKNDTVNIFNKVFTTDLLVYKNRYYARNRLLTKNGYTEWSNTFSFIARDTNILLIDMSMPTKLSPPKISTEYDINKHPKQDFVINIKFDRTLSNTKHMGTNWIIEDLNNDNVFISSGNVVNRTKILIKKIGLKPNTVYRIKASVISDSNDVSNYGYLTIKTAKE